MKKAVSFFLIVLLALQTCVICSAEETLTVQSIRFLGTVYLTEFTGGEYVTENGVTYYRYQQVFPRLEVVWSNGTVEQYPVRWFSLDFFRGVWWDDLLCPGEAITDQSADHPWGPGTHNLTLRIGTCEAQATVVIEPCSIQTFSLEPLRFIENIDAYRIENGKAYYWVYLDDGAAVLDDGTIGNFDGNSVYFYSEKYGNVAWECFWKDPQQEAPLHVGANLIPVILGGKTFYWTIEIMPNPVRSVQLKESLITIVEGETLDLTKMTADIIMTDGTVFTGNLGGISLGEWGSHAARFETSLSAQQRNWKGGETYTVSGTFMERPFSFLVQVLPNDMVRLGLGGTSDLYVNVTLRDGTELIYKAESFEVTDLGENWARGTLFTNLKTFENVKFSWSSNAGEFDTGLLMEYEGFVTNVLNCNNWLRSRLAGEWDALRYYPADEINSGKWCWYNTAIGLEITQSVIPAGKKFNDLKKEWYYDAALYSNAIGVFAGDENGNFNANRNITRAELATVLARYLFEGSNLSDAEFDALLQEGAAKNFKDLSGKWYERSVRLMAAKGIINGYGDATFRGENAVTREEMAAMLQRAFFAKDVRFGAAAQFTDMENVGEWAVQSVTWAGECGLFQGANGKFNPKSKATRAEVATVIARIDQSFRNVIISRMD